MEPDESLKAGLVRQHAGIDIVYRFLSEADDVDAITSLLHRAYAVLAAAGMHYVASHQSSDVTRRRMAKGETIVATVNGSVVGTVTLARASSTCGSPFYDRPDVASFGQFAVDPPLQGTGVGSELLALVEALAVVRGVNELALDTSENADHLIRFYVRRGYHFVEHTQWPDVNYRSVVLAKRCARGDAPIGLD